MKRIATVGFLALLLTGCPQYLEKPSFGIDLSALRNRVIALLEPSTIEAIEVAIQGEPVLADGACSVNAVANGKNYTVLYDAAVVTDEAGPCAELQRGWVVKVTYEPSDDGVLRAESLKILREI